MNEPSTYKKKKKKKKKIKINKDKSAGMQTW